MRADTAIPTTPKQSHPADADSCVARGLFSIRTCAGVSLLMLLSLGLKSVIFEPVALWPLAFVCMVPWLIGVGASRLAPRVYFLSYLFGAFFFLINMRWLSFSTGPGYVALSLYMAIYFPLVACPIRHAVRRRRWPLAIVFPVVWTGSELLRAVVMTGFPWFFLSHSQYKFLHLIQVSDLVGAYGVSFVVAAVNGMIADVLLWWFGKRAGCNDDQRAAAPRLAIVWCVTVLAACIGYGFYQLGRDTMTTGPSVAIIQGDFLNLVNPDEAEGHDRMDVRQRMQIYFSMMEAAGAQSPDLFLLPESPWPMLLNKEARGMNALSRDSYAMLQEFSTSHQAYVVVGCGSRELDPLNMEAKQRTYNSAAVFHPDGREPGRYDKIHLVYFGETVPFRFTRLHSLYLWLNSMMPFSGSDGMYEYSLFRGREFKVFRMQRPKLPGRERADRGLAGQEFWFGIPICYEDVMPYVSREFVSGGHNRKRCDFLLNISNDGWFGRGNQQPQHLAVSTFRAVENRVGIARSVNTGVSALIDPTGRIHDRVTSDVDGRWPGVCGYRVASISVDSRNALYSRHGDWFAWICAIGWMLLFVDYWVSRALTGGTEASDSR